MKDKVKRLWFRKGLVQYRLERKQSLVNPTCFFVVLATNCGRENVTNGPGSKNYYPKGEAALQTLR